MSCAQTRRYLPWLHEKDRASALFRCIPLATRIGRAAGMRDEAVLYTAYSVKAFTTINNKSPEDTLGYVKSTKYNVKP